MHDFCSPIVLGQILEDSGGCTPLFHAITQGHIEIASLLMDEHGADSHHLTNNGESAIMMAAKCGSVMLLSLLLAKNVDPLARTAEGKTVAHFAASSDRVEFL
jgi:ankyrin repeat protein